MLKTKMLQQKHLFINWIKIIFLVCLTVAALLTPVQSTAQEDNKTVLILNSYHQGFDWSDKEMQGIEAALPEGVDLVVEYMDTKRLDDDSYFSGLYEIYKRKYKNTTFDTVVTLDNNAFDFALKHRDELFPNTPLIFGGVNNFENSWVAGHEQVTGVVEIIDHRGTIEIALDLHPNTQRLFIITDQTTTGKVQHASLEEIQREDRFPVEFIFLNQGDGLDLPEILDAVKTLPPNSLIYFSGFFRDKHGTFINYEEFLPILSQHSIAPVYITTEPYLNYGTVGGKLISGYYEGKAVGEMTNQILDGESVAQIPIEYESTAKYMFDYEQLVRWEIPLSDLPEGSIVVNTPDTFYNTPNSFYNLYKEYIWGGILFIVGQMLIIAFLIINIVRRRKAETAIKQYSEHLEEMVDERTKELQDTQEQLVHQERLATLGQLAGNVAHELHNPLGAIRNATYYLDMVLENPDDDIKESLTILNREVMTSENIISSLLEFSHPEQAIRREIVLNELLEQVIVAADTPENIKFVSHLEASLPTIQADPQQLEVIFDNLIRNAVQAMSSSIDAKGKLTIKSKILDDEWIAVIIDDTGVGIAPENMDKLFDPLFTAKAKGIGLGLTLSKILIEENGGIIKVESNGVPGQGSTFTVQLPVNIKPKTQD